MFSVLSFLLFCLAEPCGESGIRTRGRREPSDVFKTSALDHYATSPYFCVAKITKNVQLRTKNAQNIFRSEYFVLW